MVDILALKRLHAAATPGPWTKGDKRHWPPIAQVLFHANENPDLIVAMHNALPALLAVAEAAEKCLPHVDPKALDYTRVHNQKVVDCYLNTMLRKALAALKAETCQK